MLFCVVFAFVSCFALWGCSGRRAIPILSAWTCARGNFPSSISGSGHSFYFLFILVFNGITIGPESEESEPDLGPRSLELSAAICSAFFHAQAPGSLQAPQPMHSNFCRLEILFLALSRFGLVQSSPAHSSSRLRDFWGPFVHVRLSYTWCPACSLLLPPVGPHVLQCKHFVVIAAPAAVTSSPMFLFRLPALPISPHKKLLSVIFTGSFDPVLGSHLPLLGSLCSRRCSFRPHQAPICTSLPCSSEIPGAWQISLSDPL